MYLTEALQRMPQQDKHLLLAQLKVIQPQLIHWVDEIVQHESRDTINSMGILTTTDAMEQMKRDKITLGNLTELKQFFTNL